MRFRQEVIAANYRSLNIALKCKIRASKCKEAMKKEAMDGIFLTIFHGERSELREKY